MTLFFFLSLTVVVNFLFPIFFESPKYYYTLRHIRSFSITPPVAIEDSPHLHRNKENQYRVDGVVCLCGDFFLF